MKLYVVQKNDSLSEIARKHGMSVEAFQKMNPGLSEKDMKQGLKVKVAVGKKPLKKAVQPVRDGSGAKPSDTQQAYPSAERNQTKNTAQSKTERLEDQRPDTVVTEKSKPQAVPEPRVEAEPKDQVWGGADYPPMDTNDFSKVFYPKTSPFPMTGGMAGYPGNPHTGNGPDLYSPYATGNLPSAVSPAETWSNPISPAGMGNEPNMYSPALTGNTPSAVSPAGTWSNPISPAGMGNEPNVYSPAATGNLPSAVSPAESWPNPISPAGMGNEPNVYSPAATGNPPSAVSPAESWPNPISPAGMGNEPNVYSPAATGNPPSAVSPSGAKQKPKMAGWTGEQPKNYPFLKKGTIQLDQPYTPSGEAGKHKYPDSQVSPWGTGAGNPDPYQYAPNPVPYAGAAGNSGTISPYMNKGYHPSQLAGAAHPGKPCGCGGPASGAPPFPTQISPYYGGHQQPQHVPFSALKDKSAPVYQAPAGKPGKN